VPISNAVKDTRARDDAGWPPPADSAPSPREIRRDRVERARALLVSGRLGRDSDALAAAIIKRLLGQS
jgi:hypothetical protein